LNSTWIFEYYKTNEFDPLPAWCPEIDSFEILNDIQLTGSGRNFLMILDYCDNVASALGLDDSGCVKDHDEVDSYLKEVQINVRLQSQYFTPTA